MREALLWEAFFSLSDKSLLGRVSRRPAKSRFKSPAHFNQIWLQAVILSLGLKAQTALQQKAELKILVDMGRAVKHVDEKQFKVHLAVRYNFKFLVHRIPLLSDSIRPPGRTCKAKSKLVMV